MLHQSADLYGSDKVLLLLVGEFVAQEMLTPVVVLPEDGPLVSELSALSVEVHIADVGKVSRSMYSLTGILALPWRLWRGVKKLDEIAGDRRVAAVHTNTLAVLLGAVWAKIRRVRHVWHLHEILISPKWVGQGLATLVRFSADVAICNSCKTREWLTSIHPPMAARSLVIFNGLPEQARPSDRAIEAFRRSIGAGPDDVVVTLLGRISKIKGQSVLIDAAALLKRQHPDLSLKFAVVGGAGPGQEELPGQLLQRVAELGLTHELTFLPFASEVGAIWHGTDIAVVPSVEPESFGMVAIEAMSAARPVVASRQGGLLDVVVDAETGMLVTPGDAQALADALAVLAADEGMRQRLGRCGQLRQQSTFTVTQQAQAVAATYGVGV